MGDATLPTEDHFALGLEASLQAKSREHDTLFGRLVAVPDLQCAWLLLLFCASTRANCVLRVHLDSARGSQHAMILACGPTLTREGATPVLDGRVGSQKCGTHVQGRMLVSMG